MDVAPEAGVDHFTMLDVSPPDLASVAWAEGFPFKRGWCPRPPGAE